MRRFTGHMRGEKYLGNLHTKEVHDLENEMPTCQIDEIIRAGHDKPFDILTEARTAGYDHCAHCIGGSRR